jgi:flagellar protein FlaJ
MGSPLSYRLFGGLFRYKPFNALSESMERTLAKARISMSGELYICNALTQSLLAGLIFIPFILALYALDFMTRLNDLFVGPAALILLIFPFLPLIAFAATLIYFSVKPRYVEISRRQTIDQNIHHASAFLYALTKSGLQPIEAIEKLAEQKSIYGFISEEFGMAKRRVKYFGEDLNTALRYVANTTSSKNLKEFIYSFILATEQSLSVGAYFKLKFEEFFEREKREREALTNNLNLIGEIIIVLVALSPTLILAVGLSLGVLNPTMISIENIYMIFILPLSAILALLYVRTVFPSHKLISTTKTAYPASLIENVPVEKSVSTLTIKDLEKNDRKLLFKNTLKKPIQILFIYPWFFFAVASIALAGVLGFFYSVGTSLLQIGVYAFLGSCLIVSVYHEIKSRYVIAIERRIPSFLRGLSETVEREGSIVRAINLVLQSKLGLLGREMKEISTTKLGFSLKHAMLMIEYRTASLVLKRVLSLLVIASESTKNMKDILIMAADDAESFIKLRHERTLNLIGYIISTYVCFGVYLYVYWTFKVSFIPSLSGLAGFAGGGAAFGVMMIQGYYISLFLALVLGLLVGAMAEGSVLSGLKHSLVMMIVAIIMLGWAP